MCSRAKTIITAPRPRLRRPRSLCAKRSRALASMTFHPQRALSEERSVSDVVIVNSGVANLASIGGAFRRLGASVVISAEAAVVREARRIVLPGVGAFGAGMATLRDAGLDAALHESIARGTPILAVCLGMQLLGEASEEASGVSGLGIIPGIFRRLPASVRIPHLGWNAVTAEAGERYVTRGVAAFANSYALRTTPPEWSP